MPDDFPDIPMDPDPAEDFPNLADEIEQTENITDSDGQSLDALDQDTDAIELEARVEDLEDLTERLPLPSFEADLFPAIVSTDGSWGEAVMLAGSLTLAGNATASDWRHFVAGDTSSGANLLSLGAGQSLVLAMEDVGTAGSFTRYLKIGTTTLFANIVSVNATIDATTWAYNITDIYGASAIAYNMNEWKNNGSTSGAIMGNPGFMGGFVGTDGATTNGCIVAPIGPGYTRVTWDDVQGVWWFNKENSAF